MRDNNNQQQVSAVLDRINGAWTRGRPQDLGSLFHDDIVMVFPGFAGRAEGKPAVLAGFEDFNENARLHEFEETDRQIDALGDVAVASFAFTVVYERKGQRYHGTGRDLWVFRRGGGTWLAVWRTMLDVAEEAIEGA